MSLKVIREQREADQQSEEVGKLCPFVRQVGYQIEVRESQACGQDERQPDKRNSECSLVKDDDPHKNGAE